MINGDRFSARELNVVLEITTGRNEGKIEKRIGHRNQLNPFQDELGATLTTKSVHGKHAHAHGAVLDGYDGARGEVRFRRRQDFRQKFGDMFGAIVAQANRNETWAGFAATSDERRKVEILGDEGKFLLTC